jgi:hypothetical protein
MPNPRGVHQGGLTLFKATMQRLLIIEHFYQKFQKIKLLYILRKLGQFVLYFWKPLDDWNFLEVVYIF